MIKRGDMVAWICVDCNGWARARDPNMPPAFAAAEGEPYRDVSAPAYAVNRQLAFETQSCLKQAGVCKSCEDARKSTTVPERHETPIISEPGQEL